MKGHKALVTGAGGFLGGWLCEELLRRGAQVVALDREWRPGARVLDLKGKIERQTGDIEHYDSLLRIMNAHDVTFVFHLAAQAMVGVALKNPIPTFQANIQGTWNVMEAVRVLRKNQNDLIKGVIVASSDKAYGDYLTLPYTEEFALRGRYPYDVSKSCTDLIAYAYHISYGVPVCITRCANLYGGGDYAFSRIVPGTIKSILCGKRPIIRSDGTPIRDYLYVRDAAIGMTFLAENMLACDDSHGDAFNLSCEAPISALNMVAKIRTLMNRTDLEPVIQAQASRPVSQRGQGARAHRLGAAIRSGYRTHRNDRVVSHESADCRSEATEGTDARGMSD
jgi:CDP-glucose 4,6-dehydratase